MNKFEQFTADAIQMHLTKLNNYSPENLVAHLRAMEAYFDSLRNAREYRVLGRGLGYPFGQNQAEWDRSVFVRGWHACLDWVRKELCND